MSSLVLKQYWSRSETSRSNEEQMRRHYEMTFTARGAKEYPFRELWVLPV